MYTYNDQIPKEKPGKSKDIDSQTQLDLYHSMLRIRLVEERIADEYHKDEMKTPIHLCIGEEAAASGVCLALDEKDYVNTNHRGHGHYLAKGGDLNKMIAELYCRTTGCSHARGGSMHLIDKEVGLTGSSSIVAGAIPLATGSALSIKMQKKGIVSTVFFGDAGAEEGSLFESMNFAELKKLPLLYVCVNNFYAVCSPITSRNTGDISKRAASFNIPSYILDGTNVEEIYQATKEAIDHIQKGLGPVFFEIRTYRWKAHGGAKEDYDRGYRSQEEFESWQTEDPIEKYVHQLKKSNLLTDETIEASKQSVLNEIDTAFKFAQNSPFPSSEDLLKYVYQE